jgi:diamine N-acetyltransferase
MAPVRRRVALLRAGLRPGALWRGQPGAAAAPRPGSGVLLRAALITLQPPRPHPWAVHDTQTGALVGFAMISDNIPQPMGDDLAGPYYLWKLLIDHRFQRRGYGAATLDVIVDYLRTRPGADVLYTSCADGPGSPRGFYLRYGFTDTGRAMWGENLLTLDLATRG